jgi:metal-responsive CopG/Arc/MetJ family transcriptional regulator
LVIIAFIERSEFAREVLRQYVETHKRWKQIRKWGMESAERLKIKGDCQVEEIIEQYRKEQSA